MAKRMSEVAIDGAADELGCEVAAVKAVIDVESRGGFLDDGRPKILFERHYFCRMTNGKHDAAAPDISSSKTGGYLGGVREWGRFDRACALDRKAALQSASWGAFQIMGSNYKSAGYDDVEDFYKAMCDSEDQQLAAFVKFVKAHHLDDELRRHDWPGFARGYNGPGYKKNNYDEKLRAAYLLHAKGGPRADGMRSLAMGNQGEDVAEIQERLGVLEDGDFGPVTKAAVIAFQQIHSLKPDGVVGPRTREKLFDVAPASPKRDAADTGSTAADKREVSVDRQSAAAETRLAAGNPVGAFTGDGVEAEIKLIDLLGNKILRQGARGPDVKSVQNALRAAGYTLVADGDYGRITTLAVKKFQATYQLEVDGEVGHATALALDAAVSERIAPLTEPAPSVIDVAPWLSRMRAISGTKEIPGTRSNPLILGWKDEILQRYPQCKPNLEWYMNDDTPWCGLAAAYVIADAGFCPPDAPLRALNWHDAWEAGKKLDSPSRGAILVFRRPGGGHVGLYEGEDNETYFVRGGNQSNMVNVTRVRKDRCVGVMWPKDGPEPNGQRIRLTGIGSLSINEA